MRYRDFAADIFRNPIAGPFVLGISSGAKLVVALAMIVGVSHGITMSSWFMIAMALIGSLLSMLFVLAVSKKVQEMSMLVVCGVMIGYICSAITDIAVTFADDSNIVNLHNWSLGSFAGISMAHVKIMTIVVVVAVAGSFYYPSRSGHIRWEKAMRKMSVYRSVRCE